MTTNTQTNLVFKKTAIVRDEVAFLTCSLSIPTTLVNSAEAQALRLVYTEMLLSGSGKLNREKFVDALSTLGSDIKVSSSVGFTNVTFYTLETARRATTKLCIEMLSKPLFSANELKRIKQHLINALILAKEDARARSLQQFTASLIDTSDPRYMFENSVLIHSVRSITIQKLETFHASQWEGVWSATCGGTRIACEETLKSIEKLRGKSDSDSQLEMKPLSVKPIQSMTVTLIDIPHKQNIEFSIGNSVSLTQASSDYAPLLFGMAVLSLYGGFSGRLMSTVREKEGLTYSIYGQLESATVSHEGFWRITTFFAPKDTQKGITSTLREIKIIREKGITADELRRFKSILNTRFALIEDSLLKKVRESHSLKLNGMSEEAYRERKTEIANLTLTEVNNALKKYIHEDELVIAGAGPIAHIRKDIESFAKSE